MEFSPSPVKWLRAAACLALPFLVPAAPQAAPSAHACLTAPSAVDFGPTAVGDTATREAILRNACRHPVTVQSLSAPPGGFSVLNSAPLRVPGLGNASLAIRYSPTDTGHQEGDLRLRAAGSRRGLRIALHGSGIPASVRVVDLEVSPVRIDETLPPGHTLGKAVTVRNHGDDSMPIYIRTSVLPPGQGIDSAAPGVSVYYLSTFHDDDIRNNFTDLVGGLPGVDTLVIRSGKTRTPSLEELLAYDMVIVSSADNWADPDSAGDVLAEYADRGRPVILMFALSTYGGDGLRGRITEPGYSPVPSGPPSPERITTHFVEHPLTQSVDWFSSRAILRITETQGKGRPLGWYPEWIIAAAYNPEKPVYFVNVLPWEPDYSGHNSLGQLFCNIIDSLQGTWNWLRNPVANNSIAFELAPGETRTFILPVGHDHALPAGIHHGEVLIYGTYPSSVRLPAVLRVAPR